MWKGGCPSILDRVLWRCICQFVEEKFGVFFCENDAVFCAWFNAYDKFCTPDEKHSPSLLPFGHAPVTKRLEIAV